MSARTVSQTQFASGRRWQFGWCEYVEVSRQLLVHGKPAKLETKPLDVLQHLLEQPTQVHTKDGLIGAVWAAAISDQSLATAISKLRRAFGGGRDDIVLNVSGIGYRMAVPVTCFAEEGTETPPFRMEPGAPIPGRPNWHATKSIGFGDPAMVWLAEHNKTREARVFKFAVDGIRLRALQREVSLSRFLRQSLPKDGRFVRILDWDLENSPFFVETEYSGLSLFEWSRTDQFVGMSLPERISLVAELAEALAAAHGLGILHNDLKPSNVLVIPQVDEGRSDSAFIENDNLTKGWRIKIADFGIATLSQPERLRAMEITYHDSGTGEANEKAVGIHLSGTAMYRAPELLTGTAPSIPGDVYALGVMLYQTASGDFLAPLSPGWESKIPDPLLRQDIADAANVDPNLRIATATELARRLRSIEARRAEENERKEAIAAVQRAERALADAQLRRPWVMFAIVALGVGLCASLFFYRRATQDRDLAEKRNATSSAMFNFLAYDLLGQSDPFHRGAPQVTLLQAIDKALPQIDRRFQDQSEAAGQLHETVAEALQNQTNFPQADAEYEAAARRFREASGPLSQDAIVSELKRESSQVQSNMPGGLDKAKEAFAQQKLLASQVSKPTPELHAWLALTQVAIAGNSDDPAQGLPILNQAIQEAEATPGFNPATLLILRRRLFNLYLRTENGPKAETAARELLAATTRLDGIGSPSLLPAQMSLQEALYAEGKYKEAIQEITLSYPRFVQLLGPANLYTLQTLATRAAAEGQIKDYDESIRDDLAVYQSARSSPSAMSFQIEGLDDAAMTECRIHRFSSGIDHARQAYRQTKSESGTLPALIGGSAFALAECLLSQHESSGSKHDEAALPEIKDLLGSIDVDAVTHFSADPSFPGVMDVAEARLNLAEKQYDAARQMANKARPFFVGPNADAYEKEALNQVVASLAQVTSPVR
jgi:serine/threonine protein kinase/DNA-binding winged helix-turn-helix (wHTH) protein